MKILSTAILIACVPLTTASAQLGKDASYFCIAEIAGGLSYDQGLKKWKGAEFSTNGRFVLRLKHLRTRVEQGILPDGIVHDYNVGITDAGRNVPRSCVARSEEPVTVPEVGWLVCTAGLREYRFNLRTNRFLSIFLIGYIDGDDNNSPLIEGGTCTKID